LQLLAHLDKTVPMKVDGLRDSAKKAATIGEFIREQREVAQVSLRQLAKVAGVSNPYLSQIERGLRKPSADILQQIAKGLRISAEQLYVRAGILESRHGDPEVVAAILADTGLTERQKQVIVEIYETFRRENAASDDAAVDVHDVAVNGKAATATRRDGRNNVDH
jgi:transcriptional regulator with XRE-family HTH domain